MNVAVTGAASFVAGALHRYCLDRGIGWCGIDAAPPGPRHAWQLDITRPGWWEQLPGGIDAIIHLAAISRDFDCRRDPVRALEVNLGGVCRVAEAAAALGIRQVVFASSEWVYGDAGDALRTEHDAIDAASLTGEYALSKLAGERLLAMAVERGRVAAATVLRFGIVYGPREANWSAVEALDHAVRTRESVEVGSLATARRFIHVDDIASGIVAAVGRDGFEIFNLTGDRLVTLGAVIETSARLHGRSPRIAERAAHQASIRNICNAKARRLLAWEPRIGLPAGLASLHATQVEKEAAA
ncbi:MAG: NAD(P)-dependent oxidoreductase [Betaproteobacteria bacterium]|nr:NAD(P)-dependent oxidoreductase [Betaproteobacteria bacterium]